MTMSEGQFDRYIADRYEHDIAWYHHRATRHPLWHRIFEITAILLTAATPILAYFQQTAWTATTASALAG